MLGRIVEVGNDNRHLSVYRGFLLIQSKGPGPWQEIGRIPLDDILAVIVNAHGVSYTNNILEALADRGVPFVLSSDRHVPVAFLWPLEGHHLQAKRMECQLNASLPRKKNVWAAIVRSKILMQAQVLRMFGKPHGAMENYARDVRSGDPDNREALAARFYWSALFGDDFRRDRLAAGANVFLNYGYTILRSAMARAVIAAGLHPSVGVHHCNDGNSQRLVDDLMEPFRPLVDAKVALLKPEVDSELTPEGKKALVSVLHVDMRCPTGRTPVSVAMHQLAASLAQIFTEERTKLDLPEGFIFDDLREKNS